MRKQRQGSLLLSGQVTREQETVRFRNCRRKARGDRTEDSVRLAGEMIEKAVRESAALGISGKEGAEYENIFGCCAKRRKKAVKKGKIKSGCGKI